MRIALDAKAKYTARRSLGMECVFGTRSERILSRFSVANPVVVALIRIQSGDDLLVRQVGLDPLTDGCLLKKRSRFIAIFQIDRLLIAGECDVDRYGPIRRSAQVDISPQRYRGLWSGGVADSECQ